MSSPIIGRMTMDELRRRLKEGQVKPTMEAVEFPNTNFINDPEYMMTAQASRATGLSHKELLARGKRGELWMFIRSPRRIYFKTAEIIVLAATLGRDSVKPDLDGYKTTDEAADILGVHRESVRRMVKDGRLLPPKIVNGRPFYRESNLRDALHLLFYPRTMSPQDIAEYTGLKVRSVAVLISNGWLAEPNSRGRCKQAEVIEWWNAWLATQAPFANEERNRNLRRYMQVVAAAEDQERTWKLLERKNEYARRNGFRRRITRATRA